MRVNPDVPADTHPYIATGHGGAKFGLTADVVTGLLEHQNDYPHLNFAGVHIHIGSQLHDLDATVQAVEKTLEHGNGVCRFVIGDLSFVIGHFRNGQ